MSDLWDNPKRVLSDLNELYDFHTPRTRTKIKVLPMEREPSPVVVKGEDELPLDLDLNESKEISKPDLDLISSLVHKLPSYSNEYIELAYGSRGVLLNPSPNKKKTMKKSKDTAESNQSAFYPNMGGDSHICVPLTEDERSCKDKSTATGDTIESDPQFEFNIQNSHQDPGNVEIQPNFFPDFKPRSSVNIISALNVDSPEFIPLRIKSSSDANMKKHNVNVNSSLHLSEFPLLPIHIQKTNLDEMSNCQRGNPTIDFKSSSVKEMDIESRQDTKRVTSCTPISNRKKTRNCAMESIFDQVVKGKADNIFDNIQLHPNLVEQLSESKMKSIYKKGDESSNNLLLKPSVGNRSVVKSAKHPTTSQDVLLSEIISKPSTSRVTFDLQNICKNEKHNEIKVPTSYSEITKSRDVDKNTTYSKSSTISKSEGYSEAPKPAISNVMLYSPLGGNSHNLIDTSKSITSNQRLRNAKLRSETSITPPIVLSDSEEERYSDDCEIIESSIKNSKELSSSGPTVDLTQPKNEPVLQSSKVNKKKKPADVPMSSNSFILNDDAFELKPKNPKQSTSNARNTSIIASSTSKPQNSLDSRTNSLEENKELSASQKQYIESYKILSKSKEQADKARKSGKNVSQKLAAPREHSLWEAIETQLANKSSLEKKKK